MKSESVSMTSEMFLWEYKFNEKWNCSDEKWRFSMRSNSVWMKCEIALIESKSSQ